MTAFKKKGASKTKWCTLRRRIYLSWLEPRNGGIHSLPRSPFVQRRKRSIKVLTNQIFYFFYCQNLRHFIRDCCVKKIKEGIFHASTIVEEYFKEDAPKEKETRREHHLISALSRSLIMREDTWMIDSGASKHMSGYKGKISNLKEKQFACMVELGGMKHHTIIPC